jgi:hypothetical protein
MRTWINGFILTTLLFTAAVRAQEIQQAGPYVLHPQALFYEEERIFGNYDGMWASDEPVRNERFIFANVKPRVEKTDDRVRLTYEADGDLGSGKKIVTISPNGYVLDYEHQAKAFKGYGEIGYWIPIEFLSPKGEAITVLDPDGKRIDLPAEAGDRNNIIRIANGQKIIVQGERAVEISLDGMTDCYGGFLQDYRGVDKPPAAHSLRFVVTWSTQTTTNVQGRIRIRVVDKKQIKPAQTSDASVPGRLQLTAPAPYFITTGQSIQIPAQFNGATPHEAGSVQWRLINEQGNVQDQGSIDIRGDINQWRHVFDLKVGRNGSYRLEATLTSGQDSWRDESLFSVFPPALDRARATSDILGASGIMEDFGDIAAAVGLTWNRRWCGVGDMRPALAMKDGRPNVEYLSHANQWEQKRGFIPLGSLTAMIDYNHPKSDWGKNRAADDAYIDAWIANQVEPMVRQDMGHIRYWEVLNEPYYEIREHPEVYFEILKRTYTAIKAIDPTLQVVGVCGPPDSIGDEWYRSLFALGAMKYMDIMSFHQYSFTNQLISNPEQRLETWIAHLRKLMREYGGRELPLWNDEASLTPPATMFTLPRYLKNVGYLDDKKSPDPREQAAVMSRILTVHYADNVKYFFHLFNASSEYTCHPMEFNGAPIPLAVAMGGIHHFLEGKRPVGKDFSHKRLPLYLFSADDNRHVVVCWLQRFYPEETVSIQWPASWSDVRAHDLFANPVDVSAAIGPEPIFLTFNSGASDAELLSQLAAMRVNLRQPQKDAAPQIGTLVAAQPSDWVGYFPVDLKPYVNRGLADEVAGDKNGGFTDEGTNDLSLLPPGDYKTDGVPFRIIDPQANDGRACLVLGSQLRSYFPMQINGIKVNQRLSRISFFHLITNGHAAGYGSREKSAFTYIIHFADGTSETIAVKEGDNVADWWHQGNLPHARVAFEMPGPQTDRVSVFQYDWTSPKGAAARIESIDVHSGNDVAIPVVLAITGVLSN